MNQEMYNLTWHTYSDHLREMLKNLLKENYQSDVTLVSDDKKQVRAHKIVLSACSTVLKDKIDNVTQNDPIIFLNGIQHQEVKNLVQFMYLGETKLCKKRMNKFLDAAKSLEVKEISQTFESQETEDDKVKETNASNNTTEAINQEQVYEIGGYKSKHRCNQCDYQASNNGHLTMHIKAIHEGVKFDCKHCDKKFSCTK